MIIIIKSEQLSQDESNMSSCRIYKEDTLQRGDNLNGNHFQEH